MIQTAEIIWDRDHGKENEGYYVRLHSEDAQEEDVILEATTAAEARAEVESMYPGIEITDCDEDNKTYYDVTTPDSSIIAQLWSDDTFTLHFGEGFEDECESTPKDLAAAVEIDSLREIAESGRTQNDREKAAAALALIAEAK